MSRAYYGVDCMIDQDFNAKLLEVTFAPDMERFSLFQPEAWNELFGHLFFDEDKNMTNLTPLGDPPKPKKAPKPLPAEYIMKAQDNKVVAEEDKKEETVDGALDGDFVDGFDAFDDDY